MLDRNSYPAPSLILAAVAAVAGAFAASRVRSDAAPSGLTPIGPTEVVVRHPDRERPLVHTFRLKNPTDRPIRIKRVRTSCSCTTAESDARPVRPGEIADVTVSVNSFGRDRDDFDEHAFIETESGTIPVRISGRLPPAVAVQVRPHAVSFRAPAGTASGTRTVELLVPDGVPRLTGRDIRVIGPLELEVRLDALQGDGPYRRYELRVALARPMTAGGGQGSLRVDAGRETVFIPIVAVSSEYGSRRLPSPKQH